MLMKLKLTILLLCFLASFKTAAQDAKPDKETKPAAAKQLAATLPTIDQVLDKYVQAIGGKAAVLKTTSRLVKGPFEIPAASLKGTAEIYAKAPDKTLVVFTIPGFGAIQQGYNGKIGWSKDPVTGLRELTAVELALVKRSVDFHREIKLQEVYKKMTVKEKNKVGDAEVYVVEATPAEGSPETMYFDAQSGLLIRSDFEFDGPQGKLAIETYYEDYRETGAIKMPFTERLVHPILGMTRKTDEVKHNVPIEDSKFDKPKAP